MLLSSDGTYYTGSTKNLVRRIAEHQAGLGANHTMKRLPVKLIYYEEFTRIDWAFNREKQIQGWSRKKKESLINGLNVNLPILAACQNISHSIFEKARKHQEITPELENWAIKILVDLGLNNTKED